MRRFSRPVFVPSAAAALLALALQSPAAQAQAQGLATAGAQPPAAQEEDADEGPTEEEIDAAVAALDAALGTREASDLITACGVAASVPHADVAERLADVLRARLSEEGLRDVRRAAILALGSQGSKVSLDALHRYFEKGEFAKQDELQEDEAFATTLLRAIAAHEHPSSIERLLDDVNATPGKEPMRARILGLGRIRTHASLEAVFDLMGRVTQGRRGQVRQMQDFRLALVVLTGTDQGMESTAWLQWWNEAQRDFEVPEEPPRLPEDLQERWRRYWGFPKPPERGAEREDRGGGTPRRW